MSARRGKAPLTPEASADSFAPDAETIELLRHIKTEIGAGMVLKIGLSPEELAHNNACDRANAIITNYQEGYGLFQMTRRAKRRNALAESSTSTDTLTNPKEDL